MRHSMRACALEPRMSWRQRRQSKLMDSENAATSADAEAANRPDRETAAGVERVRDGRFMNERIVRQASVLGAPPPAKR